MSRSSATSRHVAGESWLGAATCGAFGMSGFLAVGALLSGSIPLTVAAGGVGSFALLVLLATEWLGSVPVLVLSLPLPALFASDTVRMPPALLVTAIVVSAWALRRGVDGHPLRLRFRSIAPLSSMVAAVFISALFARSRLDAARELVNVLLLLALLLALLDSVRVDRRRAHSAARWVAATAAVAGMAAVVETLGLGAGRFPLPSSGLYRAAGGFGWPNELGMFLAIALPLALHQVARTRGWVRTVWMVASACVAMGLASTFSRGSWLSAALAPVSLLLVGRGRAALLLWGAGILGAAVFDVASGGALVARIAGTTGDVLVTQRLLLSAAGLLMFQASPLVGVGPGGFGDALERFGPQISGLFDFVGSAHNGYVHIAAEVGIFGFITLLLFFGSTWVRLLLSARSPGGGEADRELRAALLWSFTTVCLVTLFEWPFAHGVGELIVLVAAIGLAGADDATDAP